MKHASPFVISEFTNPSGKIVFQLYSRIDGKRFRKNFPTRAEADAERQIQEVQWLQHDTGTRAAITRTREVRAHLAKLGLRISSLDFRRFCKRHGIARDERAGRPRTRSLIRVGG